MNINQLADKIGDMICDSGMEFSGRHEDIEAVLEMAEKLNALNVEKEDQNNG